MNDDVFDVWPCFEYNGCRMIIDVLLERIEGDFSCYSIYMIMVWCFSHEDGLVIKEYSYPRPNEIMT